MRRALISSLVVAAAVLAAPMAASADSYTYGNNSQILIPTVGAAAPYPSTIHVAGVQGPVADVEVGLVGVTHTRPKDLDILLVPPDGHAAVVMSDACGTTAATGVTWLFNSSDTFSAPRMGDTCPAGRYRPTNLGDEADSWFGSPGTGAYTMENWHHKPMNGDWKLYIVDDQYPASGKIANGWTLKFTTKPVDTFVPGAGTSGVAGHYPVTQTVRAPGDVVVKDVKVELADVAADRASDLDLLLQGPNGQTVMLMAGACGGAPLDNPSFLFDQQAAGPLPVDATSTGCGPSASPSNYKPAAFMAAPAPIGPYGSSLGVFDGTSSNGDWKLYAQNGGGGDGYIGKFTVSVASRPKATLQFAQAAATVPEGATQSVTITRSAKGTLGPADVAVTTTPGSASAGADFTTLSQTVHFDRDEAEKTVTLDAIDDGAAEPDETYALTLSDPTGDAQLGTQTQVDVTIPASAGKPDTGHKPRPVPLPTCDGNAATIVGTAGKDILRGTRGADVIAGLGGNDKIAAVNGNDIVCGGAGSDMIAGGAGRDRLLGGPGNDRLTGGAGRDTCLGGRGRNRVSCERKAVR